MAEPRFPFLPTCCQPIAELLDRENRTGARNCPKGHLVSLDYVRMLEADAKRKAAEAAAEAGAAEGRRRALHPGVHLAAGVPVHADPPDRPAAAAGRAAAAGEGEVGRGPG